nr:Spy/CpxP family protein refolding chaperone [uncultured Dongia sp.]
MRASIFGAVVAALLTTSVATAQQAPQGMMGPGMMNGGMPTMGMMHGVQHIEGQLAFLKTELKINDTQAPQWNVYAEARRTNAKRMNELMNGMMKSGMMGQGQGMGMDMMNQGGMMKHHAASLPLPERLKLMDQHMMAHMEMMQAIKGPTLDLYAVLSKEQKLTADELLLGHMGMM